MGIKKGDKILGNSLNQNGNMIVIKNRVYWKIPISMYTSNVI